MPYSPNHPYSPNRSDEQLGGKHNALPSALTRISPKRLIIFGLVASLTTVLFLYQNASIPQEDIISTSFHPNSPNLLSFNTITPELPPLIENSTLTCPKWEPFNVKQQGDKDFSLNCRVVTTLPSFEISLCESMRECGQGYFLIQRRGDTECKRMMGRAISWDPDFETWMKESIGPDAFTFVFSGRQRTAPSDWRHLGNCLYKHPYRLTNPGLYTVTIMHTHDNFHAIQEKERTWQRVVNQPLLVDFELDVCSQHCPAFTVKEIQESWSKKRDYPICDRENPVQGVYLRSGVEGVSMLEREQYKYEAFKVPYFWMPLGCKYDQLFELNSNSHCHDRNQSIKFIGDSQVRVAWDVLDRRLAGTKDLLSHNVHEGSRINYYVSDSDKNKFWEDNKPIRVPDWITERRTTIDFAGRDGHLHWFAKDYVDNPEYERDGNPESEAETNGIDRNLKRFDAMVFNVGMWPMSGIRDGGHFTAARFKAMLYWSAEAMMEMNRRRVIAMKREPIVIVWHGLASYPVFTNFDDDDKKRKDWRSPYRLKIWSDIAEQVLSNYGIRRLNAFELTMPFIYETPDGGHYYKTPAVEAETDEMLHKLNICGSTF
ncbi:UNVERIFIED_CONTAM: hypothetical protein HDU68_007276 [Siphonaria sp. JEL0065]|nr:hypothetical protein HDU68_007276 [Siphonaria sp. JEL0065]